MDLLNERFQIMGGCVRAKFQLHSECETSKAAVLSVLAARFYAEEQHL